MKKAFIMIVALFVFAGFSTLTFAQGEKPAEAPAKEAVEQKGPAEKATEQVAPVEQQAPEQVAPAEQKAEVIEGAIVSTNLEAKTMVVKIKDKDAEKIITVEDAATLGALKAGEEVKVTLKAGGDIADKVEVVAAAKDKGKGKGKKKGGKK